MAAARDTSAKKNFALRLRADMMEAVERWAADEYRSTNGQIEYLLQEALRKNGRLPKPKLGEVPDEANQSEQAEQGDPQPEGN